MSPDVDVVDLEEGTQPDPAGDLPGESLAPPREDDPSASIYR